MSSVENESSEIPELLEIPEQNLQLINEFKPYYYKEGDLYVIIARGINIRNGINNGDLRAGIIRLFKETNTYELVLPFSKNLINAIIKEGMVKLVYVENRTLKTKSIPFDSEGKLNFDDYAFLLDEDEKWSLKPSYR